ncbi:FeoA family protein [Stieleria varia]|uniref:FeoA domain protein n=1 Tax=Stieleria varia TaxID=2528005 RepID=A0A5C6AQX2_9BACT|nr:FeoA family protein [Stieleria varia]TWU02355.1 FeoA domain protein [Stieleria varia]
MIKPLEPEFHEFKLSEASVGELLCCGITANEACHIRMKSLGICEGRRLELLSNGDPMIVRVAGSRIGLSRSLAASVSVSEAAGAQKNNN